MSKKTVVLIVALMFMLSLFVTGFTTLKQASPANNTLNVANGADFTAFDPQGLTDNSTLYMVYQTFEFLVDRDKTGKLIPALATSWTVDKTGKVYQFKIRQGVKFHNGSLLTVEDVKFSLERAMASSFTKTYLSSVAKVDVVNSKTIKITLIEPYVPFIASLTQNIFMVNKKLTEANGGKIDETNYIGTGPYKYVSRNKGVSVTLEAFDYYWGKKPSIKNVVINVIKDVSSAEIAMEKGEADWAFYLGEKEATLLRGSGKGSYVKAPTAHTRWLFMSASQYPMNNKLFRQAVAYAVDKEAINIVTTNSSCEIAQNYLAPGVVGLDKSVKTYEYDPDKAIALLEKSKVPLDTKITIQTLTMPAYSKMAEVTKACLNDIGLTNVEIIQFDGATLLKNAMNGLCQLGTMAATNNLLDADNLYSNYGAKSSFNMIKNQNPKLESLLLSAKKEQNSVKRNKLYSEAQKIIRDESWIVPVLASTNYQLINKKLKGAYVPLTGFFRFNNLSW